MSKVEESVDAATGRVITVVVGSKNPVKVAYVVRGCGSAATWTSLWLFNNRACREAFAAAYPGHTLVVEGVGAPSGVSDQPMTDEETQPGARNRARNGGRAVADSIVPRRFHTVDPACSGLVQGRAWEGP